MWRLIRQARLSLDCCYKRWRDSTSLFRAHVCERSSLDGNIFINSCFGHCGVFNGDVIVESDFATGFAGLPFVPVYA